MSLALIGTLAVLALIDSTSFGTLLIPIWLMLAPGRVRVSRVLAFLATVAVAYFLLGLLLATGVEELSGQIEDVLASRPVQVLQLVLGLGLLAAGVRMGRRPADGAGPGRLLRWRDRAVAEEGSVQGLITLAVGAVALESASMLPYIGAIGLIGTADVAWTTTVLTLAAYCLVMVAPALLLLAGRMGAARLVEPVLARIDAWLARTGRESTAWLLGIVGVLLALDALGSLGVTG